jgi:hypothetical protein
VRVLLLVVVLGACAPPPSAPPADAERPSQPETASDEDLADEDEARRSCDDPLSPIAAATPSVPHDDPALHVGLEKRYEAMLDTSSADDPKRPILLDRIAARYVEIEQTARRDLQRACFRPRSTLRADVVQTARAIRSAVSAMAYGGGGAKRSCVRLATEHPTFKPATRCNAH